MQYIFGEQYFSEYANTRVAAAPLADDVITQAPKRAESDLSGSQYHYLVLSHRLPAS